ncbi:hypothetical protein M514_10065 [Trichuris suis]|uniref:RAP domain-containing protein n=1 Tax=Trichuris suis TaxID=68888 RepID=A0A085LVM1_9BILA|nr:hypothetical protein M513_10065 [Trichuris suis]KFD60973.1 hypothetical protein M514_10065 [Trichuris suis]
MFMPPTTRYVTMFGRVIRRALGDFHTGLPSTVKRVPVESAFFKSYIERLEFQCYQQDKPTVVACPEWMTSLKKNVALASNKLHVNAAYVLKQITGSAQSANDTELIFLIRFLADAFDRSFFVHPLPISNGESLREFARILYARFGSIQRWNNQHDLLKSIILAVKVNSLSSEFPLTATASNVSKLKTAYLLRLVYFFMKRREVPEPIMDPLETAISNHLDKLSLDDLALIAISFFKCKRPIRTSNIVKCMAERLCSQLAVGCVADVSVTAILKQLRYVERGEFWIYLRRLVQSFAQLPVDKFMLVNWVHLAYWCTKLCFFDKQFAVSLLEKYFNSRGRLRAKDVAIIFHYFTLLNYPEIGSEASDSVDALLIDEFRNKAILDSCNQFPEVLSAALRCAAMRNKYPMDLIKLAFSREFLDLFSRNRRHYFPLSDIFFLDCSIAIDRPECSDHRLNMADFFAIMAAHKNVGKCSHEKAGSSKYSRLCISLMHTLCEELHCCQNDVYFGAVLPHFTAPDLLLSFSNGKLRKGNVPLALKSYSFQELQVADSETRVVLLLCHNNRCRLFTTTWLGHVEARKRQLLRLGYNIVELNGNELDHAPLTSSNKQRLIETLNNFNRERVRGAVVRLF